jgi:uncharacterized protein YndB with AHSA1/START domain
VDHPEVNSSIVIAGSIEAVWRAMTDEEKLTQWYAPGSPWEIPNLNAGEKMIFTLMPSAHNQLTEKLPMSLTIEKATANQEFSFYLDSQQTLISFVLVKEKSGIRVTANMGGYEMSLANLQALVEGRELPYI